MFKEVVSIKVYNIDTKEVVGIFEDLKSASNFLGITIKRLDTEIKRAGRIYNSNLPCKITLRYGNRRELDKDYVTSKILEKDSSLSSYISDMSLLELINFNKDLKLKSYENIPGLKSKEWICNPSLQSVAG